MKLNTKTKNNITQSLRWSVFIMSAFTLSMKIAEVSAYKSFELIVSNPELAQYSHLVTGSFF